MKKYILLCGILIAKISCLHAQLSSSANAASLLLDLQKLNTVGSVIYIAAHPDDENTELLTYLVNERKVRTAYLSLTRGDGGQNLIGSEQGEQIGVIRTQELVAARRVDGAEQYFTRAYDFGFSKNPEEVFKFWNKDSVLADVVWAIRKFRPDVIITRFPTTGEGGHGQHTASAIIAVEAYSAAADPKQFAEQLKYVQPWQAKRLLTNYLNNFGTTNTTNENQLKIMIGQYNTLLGYSYGEIAALSRSMHRCQGMGTPLHRGLHKEYFQLLNGSPAEKDLFDDIELSWKRYADAKHYSELISEAIKTFNTNDPLASVALLMQALNECENIKDLTWRNYERDKLKKLILDCSGFFYEATADEFSKTEGDKAIINISCIKRSNAPVSLVHIAIPSTSFDTSINTPEEINKQYSFRSSFIVSAKQPYTTPYWLQFPKQNNLFTIPDQRLVGLPEISIVPHVNFTFSDGNSSFTIATPIGYKSVDPVKGEYYLPFEILPEVSLEFQEPNYLFANGTSKTISIVITANDSNCSGELIPLLPAGWKIIPVSVKFHCNNKGERLKEDFELTPPAKSDSTLQTEIFVKAIVNDKKFDQKVVHISYDHIPTQVILKPASAKLIALPLQNKARNIAYLKGAGDEVPKSLQQMGCNITFLNPEEIMISNLDSYDAIVTGVRFFNIEKQAAIVDKALLDYVRNGGTVVCQYNTNSNLVTNLIGPYSFTISDKRVTDEKSPMVFIAPNSSILNYPNKITPQDFDGWIQERGLYFCTDVDPHYEMPLQFNDPGEASMGGSLLYCKFGKGNFIYTSLAFFRELPAGVPGAYRLFANLISAGK